jgi:uncharacterized protein
MSVHIEMNCDRAQERIEPYMEIIAVEYEVLSDLYVKVQQRFAGFDDLAHGWEHVKRVYSLAVHIAEQEGADRFITGMAALMHDLGRLSHETTRHHADLSAMFAAELLIPYHLAQDTQEAILHAIIAHSYSRGIEPYTLEAGVLRDADRLDSLGAIGILRWAITGTIRRTPQTQTYNPDDPFAERHIPDDKKYMLDHFFAKLLKLPDGMITETGRMMAEQRVAFMRTYLDELRRELDV